MPRQLEDPYQTFLRELIAPALRHLGFRGSHGVFVLPSEEYWALVGFQSHRYGAPGQAHFTINLTIVSKAAWEAERAGWTLYLPARPPATIFGADPAEQIRIGALVPVSDLDHDRWWDFDDRASSERVADEVIAAIRDHALPWLQSRMI